MGELGGEESRGGAVYCAIVTTGNFMRCPFNPPMGIVFLMRSHSPAGVT